MQSIQPNLPNQPNLPKQPNHSIKIQEYINSLNEIQKKSLSIAKEHLGTSFDIERSNGYKEWIKKNNQ